MVYASVDAGIDVNFSSFNISVRYNVAVKYKKNSDLYIRDPQYVLFDLLRFLKANKSLFQARKQTLVIYLYQDDYIEMIEGYWESDNTEYKVLNKTHVDGNFTPKIVEMLCELVGGKCVSPETLPSINLYRCGKDIRSYKILFGSFPSEEINDKYCLEPPSVASSKDARIKITRKNIYQFFSVLPE
jgi:hypothetical protein